MNKYLAIGALGFLMGMKYRKAGFHRCACYMKKQMRRMLRMV